MDYGPIRRQNLLQSAKPHGLGSLLLTNPVSVTYLTGFTGDSSYLFLSEPQTILISDDRFAQQIAEECPGMDVHIRPHSQTLPEAVGQVLQAAQTATVGLEADHVTLALHETLRHQAPHCTFVPTTGLVEELRSVKDPSEVEQIRQAILIAEQTFRKLPTILQESSTEKELVDWIENTMRQSGATGSSFPPIVAFGERGALPHAPPTHRPLQGANQLLIDWGADLLYKSDLTRTLVSPFAKPLYSSQNAQSQHSFERIYEAVHQAQLAAAAAVHPGVPACEVDSAARRVLAEAGYEQFFTHGLGHGIGLDIHELPRVRSNSTELLQIGMVITLEPGVYIPGWGGIRIEDDFLITKDGTIRLSTLPHDPSGIG
ncbi:MAG: Xaa-Pro peptidase family protein [Bacteroidales bacterium]|nr:Xaa-Pro peptidase family protein [Bacteroidales bacterium]